ncbi:MAG TPA: DUF6443 domain-containing protein, partial [Chryseolinea sp.]|nr:DUF6443 domain-containing protein [Chryseolinea sp.]
MNKHLVFSQASRAIFSKKVIRAISGFHIMVALCLIISFDAHSAFVQRIYGSGCVGANNLFALQSATCSSVFWTVSGTNYTIVSQDNTSIIVKWNVPNANVYVTANFSSCSTFPSSGSAFSAAQNVGSPVTPTISIIANQNNVCLGSSITFTASITNGGTAPSYYWMVNGSAAPGATSSATYTTTALVNTQSVTCQLTSNVPCPTAAPTSNAVVMTLNNPSPVSVSITSTTLPWCNGMGSFIATVTNGGPSPTYAWYKNNILATDNLTGVPANVYAPSGGIGDQVPVKCVVTSNQSCISGNPATSNVITVSTTAPITPSGSIVPSVFSICAGSNITFTASATADPNYSLTNYTWQLNGINAGTANTPFTTNAYTQGSTVTLIPSYTGACLVTPYNPISITGNIAVNPYPSAVQNPSGPLKICSSCSQTITSTPGTGYTFQWKNGAGVILGATSPTYTTSVAGSYYYDVTANGCTSSTASASLGLTKNVAPVPAAGADATVTLPLNSTVLSGSGSDGDGTIASYLWAKQSGPAATMSNPNSASLTLTNMDSGDHVYRLYVTDNFGEQSSGDDIVIHVVYPSNNYNKITENVVLVPSQTTETQVMALTIGKRQETIQYLDGLGKPIESIVSKGSPSALDIVQPIVYDSFAREFKKYLPFTSGSTGVLQRKTTIINAAQPFYVVGSNNQIADDARPYGETVFEPSPLNRPSKEFGAGSSWYSGNKAVEHAYLSNQHGTTTGLEKIISWTITSGLPVRNAAVGSEVLTGGYYATNQLTVKSTKDENGNETREYTAKNGKMILRKVYIWGTKTDLETNGHWAKTYYIYDQFNNLRFVLPPELSVLMHVNDTNVPSPTQLDQVGYQYKYDARNRMVEKKIPGAAWVYMVYDARDRLVLTQDGNQRSGTKKYWTFTKYDLLNRPILTGIKDTALALTQSLMQDAVNNFYAKVWTKYGESFVG